MKSGEQTTNGGLFDDLREATPENAAQDLAKAIESPPDDGIDEAIIELLADRRAGDSILDHLPLSSLETLAERCMDRLEADVDNGRPLAWRLLDVLRRSALLCRIAEAEAVDQWSDTILRLVEASHYTFAALFRQRASGYGERALFRVPTRSGSRTLSWRQVAGRVDLIARSLLALRDETGDRPLAILSTNSLDMALVDLACLTSGIVNIMVPATSTDSDVEFILNHADVGGIVVSDNEQLQKVLKDDWVGHELLRWSMVRLTSEGGQVRQQRSELIGDGAPPDLVEPRPL